MLNKQIKRHSRLSSKLSNCSRALGKPFGINKAFKNGFKVGNSGIMIHLSKGKTALPFDEVLKTKIGLWL